jgi:hypothetical protein
MMVYSDARNVSLHSCYPAAFEAVNGRDELGDHLGELYDWASFHQSTGRAVSVIFRGPPSSHCSASGERVENYPLRALPSGSLE